MTGVFSLLSDELFNGFGNFERVAQIAQASVIQYSTVVPIPARAIGFIELQIQTDTFCKSTEVTSLVGRLIGSIDRKAAAAAAVVERHAQTRQECAARQVWTSFEQKSSRVCAPDSSK